MGSGKAWRLVERDSDFFDEAKAFIKSKWGIEDSAEQIHLACYVEGCEGRLEFKTSQGYWNMQPSTTGIYFWVGPRQKSPARDLADLREEVTVLKADVKRLKVVSSTTKNQLEIWKERRELSLEKFDTAFVPNQVDALILASVLEVLKSGPAGSKECNVQDMWNGIMPDLTKSTQSTWKDCRCPNGIQFDGRRHDIDLVLLRRDALSILYLDSSIELKDSIATDARRQEVVLQLLDRFGATFDGQEERQVCWGMGADGESVLFVKCNSDLSYEVTANLPLMHEGSVRRLMRFLSASAMTRGYVDITLPDLFGTSVSSRLGKSVYLLDDGNVCKLGQKQSMEAEHRMLCSLNKIPFLGLDVKEDETFETGCATDGFQFGFRMSKYDVVRVVTEQDVIQVTGHIFWRLAILHRLGIVHRDIKPSNILYASTRQAYFPSDYGAAHHWKSGEDMGPAGTEAFSSIPGEFAKTEGCLFRQDLESLFWTSFLLWIQVLKNKDDPGRFSSSRKTLVSVLAIREGAFAGEEEKLHVPESAVLRKYLVDQAKSKTLLLPFEVFSSIYSAGMKYTDFNSALAKEKFLACPEDIFNWLQARVETDTTRTEQAS